MDLNSEVFATFEETHQNFIGELNIFIQEAHDIYNICIYHEQDSYAKLYLTSDPESVKNSRVITYAGRNPVFNENFRLNVKTLDSCLKCEIWMLSKAQEFLNDQLLGLCLVPLSDVVLSNGKLEKDFVLSSTELFHSPAGFIKLSIRYDGSLPDVMAVTSQQDPRIQDAAMAEPESESLIPSAFEKLEFPDLNVANENQIMVSELLGIPPTSVGSVQAGEISFIHGREHYADNEAGHRLVESFSSENSNSVGSSSSDTPRSCVSTSLSSALFPTSGSLKNSSDNVILSEEEEDDSSLRQTQFININLAPEEEALVQKKIVDMYSESMQEFEKILANLKLPMDTDDGKGGGFRNSDSDPDPKILSSSSSSRVYYGSRAFF